MPGRAEPTALDPAVPGPRAAADAPAAGPAATLDPAASPGAAPAATLDLAASPGAAPAAREPAVSRGAAPAARVPGRRLLVVRLLLCLGVVAALVVGLVLAVRAPAAAPVPAAVPAASAVPGPVAPSAVPAPSPAAPAATTVRATTLDVPSLGIRTSALVELGVDASGVLVPPSSTAVAGWFTGSAPPGEVGPTVIAGHVDSYLGPGIFFHLDAMKPGDVVTVGRSDGRSARYRVTDVLVVPKTQFPTDRVYGPTPGPELRLITCGGEFDRSARRYLRNVVVSAVLVGDYPGSP